MVYSRQLWKCQRVQKVAVEVRDGMLGVEAGCRFVGRDGGWNKNS
jgi:hypothetical protein